MRLDDPAFTGWQFHCASCNHALPLSKDGRIHKNRKYCPDCYSERNEGKIAQSNVPEPWQGRCSFFFVRENFPHLYEQLTTSYIDSGWEFHCIACNHGLPLDTHGRVHTSRKYCPDCYSRMNPGVGNDSISQYWVERCSFRFVRENFPLLYEQLKSSYLESLGIMV
jgi:Zn finger protein HypA/HybF involved in hydrogenase expression